jgi:hypothetical protein
VTVEHRSTMWSNSCCGWGKVKVAGQWDQWQTRETGAAIATPYTAMAELLY